MAGFQTRSVELTYNKGFENEFRLSITGEYYKGTPDTYMEQGDSPEFLLEKVELSKGDLYDLIAEELSLESILDKVYDELG
jgi:hypothetical protein